jgi:hypothetical protein
MAYRTRVFIDFWNFSLNWNQRAHGDRLDWPQVPRVLLDESKKLLEVAGITEPLALEETLVYASYNPQTEGKLKKFLDGFLDKQPSSDPNLGKSIVQLADMTMRSAANAKRRSPGPLRRALTPPSLRTCSRWPPKMPMTLPFCSPATRTTFLRSSGCNHEGAR